MDEISGGCLCGAVRLRLRARPLEVMHCHCSMCRRASGAAFVTWASARRADLDVTGVLRWRDSSAEARRGFCADCGSQLLFARHDEPDDVDVAVGCLDDAGALRPTRHIWVEARLPWVAIDDGLPRHREDSGSPEIGQSG